MKPRCDMVLRPMTREDLDAVCALEKQCFSVPWSRESMEKELRENVQAHYLVAEVSGAVAGYAGFWQVLDEGHIMNIAVAPEHRGHGLGEALMREMLRQGNGLGIIYWTLEVRVSNTAAVRLYEKVGFTSAGIRPGYYEKPKEDARIMWYQFD